MTRAGWDPFFEAERQASTGRTTMLATPDGVSWLLVPGRPWQWRRQGPWQFGQPPRDPGYRAAARLVPPSAPAPAPPMPPRQQPPPLPVPVRSGPSVEQLVTGSRFLCGDEPVSEFLARVVRIVGWADRTRHPEAAAPPPPPEPEPPAQSSNSGMINDLARNTRSVTLDLLAAGNRARKSHEQRKEQEQYERRHQEWQQQYRLWEEQQRRQEMQANEQRQPNPLILLIGRPHTGQRRLFRALCAQLEAGGVGFGGSTTSLAQDLLAGTDRPVDTVLRNFIADCEGREDPPAMLVDEADALFGEKSGGVTRYLGELAHDQESCRLVVLGGTEEFLNRLTTDAPELVPRLLVYRLPDLSQPAAISALFDLFAAERSMVLAPAARERLVSLAGQTDDARQVEALLAAASQSSLGRGAARDGAVHIELPDVEQFAATIRQRPGEKPIEDLLAELDAMIGLDSVKQRVRSLANEMTIDAQRKQAGLPVAARSRHLVFTGNPGTAKTTVARLVAQIYRALGVLPKGQVVEVARPDLVGQYVGETSQKTRDVCQRAMGGVLFLDEAYNLVNDDGDDFGREAVTELLLHMENHRDDFIVFAAGYPKEMDGFMESNPGLRSRFAGRVDFPDYSNEELAAIFRLMAENQGYQLAEDFAKALPEAVRRIPRGRGFANGRSARGLLETTIGKQSSRLAAQPRPDPAALSLLTAADLPSSGEAGVGQADDSGPRRGLEDLLAELDGMIGLDSVKQRIRTLVAETRLDARRREAGLPVAPRSRTWWASISGRRRRRPARCASARSAGCCSSTRPTTWCRTRRTTSAVRRSPSCWCRWRTTAAT